MRRLWYALLMFACLGAGLWATPPQVHAQNQDYLDQLPPLIDRDLFFGDPEIASAQL
ncbi:MAG: hypothetical protein GVY18_02790, partial [Bacteroidetes bacterium]|nr:hypothetical protein [Bacteroidota bacterium]